MAGKKQGQNGEKVNKFLTKDEIFSLLEIQLSNNRAKFHLIAIHS